MEAKKRRLECKTTEKLLESNRNPSPFVNQLSSDKNNDVLKALLELKKLFNSPDDVDTFLLSNQQFFQTLMLISKKFFSDLLLSSDAIRLRIIKESVAVLANCCYLSSNACLKLMQPGFQIGLFAVRILESGDRTDTYIKASILRLIANICKDSQLSKVISTISTLVDRIMMAIINESNEISSQALRIVGLLVKSPMQAKKIIESNGCYYLGNRLAKYDLANLHEAEFLLDIFNSLIELRPRDVGRQLVNSECSSLFLNVILCHELSNSLKAWALVILRLTKNSFEIRESFGQQNAIERALELASIGGHICEFLCYFSKDAWGRMRLRESGALNRILENLHQLSDLDEQLIIISSLKNFSHDQLGLSYLCHRVDFVDLLLKKINKFLNENKVECNIELVEEENVNRPSSPEFKQLAKRLHESTSFKKTDYLYKEFLDNSVSQSPKSLSPLHPSWSPSMSPSTMSMSPSSSYGSLLSQNEGIFSGIISSPSDSISGWRDGMDIDDQENYSTEHMIILDSVAVLTLLTYQDENHVYLVKENVMDTLINYISDAKGFNMKLARSITRLTRNPLHLQQLLSMNFHEIVLDKLVRRTCFLTRYAKTCGRCEMRKKFGRDLLQEFSTHVDKPLGWNLLQIGLNSNEQNKRLDLLMASLVLIRSHDTRARFFHNYMPIESLVSIMDEILMNPDYETDSLEEINIRSEKRNSGVTLCCRIIAAFSTIIPRKIFDEILEIDHANVTDLASNLETGLSRPENTTEIECVIEQISDQSIPKLEFRSKTDGESISIVPKNEFCNSNGFFQGMFGNEFVEQIEDRQIFQFDENQENCIAEDFCKFLHYLSGCQNPSDCVRINSVETACALLYLSDKYICVQLADFLLRQNGPVKRLLTGESLKEFLPCIISITNVRQRLGYLAMLILLRFSTHDQIRTVFGQISGNRLAVDSFLELFKDFLIFCIHNTLPHQSTRILL